MKFKFFLRLTGYGSQRVVFLRHNWPRIKTSSKQYQNKPKSNIWCYLTPNRLNMKCQLILRWFTYDSQRVVFLRQNLTYDAISSPIDWIWSFNWFWGGLLMVQQELCFCGKNWMILKISTNPYLCFFLIYWYD